MTLIMEEQHPMEGDQLQEVLMVMEEDTWVVEAYKRKEEWEHKTISTKAKIWLMEN